MKTAVLSRLATRRIFGKTELADELAFHVPSQSTMPLRIQVLWLFILAIPVSCISWTITHEEVFREGREYCEKRSKACKELLVRKVFYVFTCEYCLSHWVALFWILLTGYRLLLDDWRGVFIAVFSLVWVANLYMAIYGRLRLGIKAEVKEIELKEEALRLPDSNSEPGYSGNARGRQAVPRSMLHPDVKPQPR